MKKNRKNIIDQGETLQILGKDDERGTRKDQQTVPPLYECIVLTSSKYDEVRVIFIQQKTSIR